MAKGDRYVHVPADVLEAFLQSKGFVRTVRFHEVVYMRAHAGDNAYRVLVYTSIRDGAMNARGLGQDAIRVCAVKDVGGGRTVGIAKLPRVYRTGSVEDVFARMLVRMREAYDRCSKDRRRQLELRKEAR
jgi:hypothetical protein